MGRGEIVNAVISARGIVQGVGFRPFVYQLALRLKLSGRVYNTSEDVRIEVEGDAGSIDQFYDDLQSQAPPQASIESVSITPGQLQGYRGFTIEQSLILEDKYQLISPDIATCSACISEIFDVSNRRYRYPFTNCTNCGPRFTIIESIPYDRPRTTMRRFTMCPACQAEYDNPLDRRFHAQPNACPVCGPRLQLLDGRGKPVDTPDVVSAACNLLQEGKIIAIKGLGGFLLACDALEQAVVTELRRRKRRPSKPFAIMVADISEMGQYCLLSTAEEKLFGSTRSPIVLARCKDDSPVCEAVAPKLKHLGIMLPYTPLHHILLRETGRPLVMTSGNLSEEPIAADNPEAVLRLGGIADFFLIHNRDIYARYDDSVALVAGNDTRLVRRARGYSPHPIRLPFSAKPVLACGAEEKNTFCLTRDNYAFISQHIGDMENLETIQHYENTIMLYKKLFSTHPEVIAHDLHPEYHATRYALNLKESNPAIKLVPVQHHHAHIASCMAENGYRDKVIGVAFDGTGYGSDGQIWGGEFMIADYRSFQRVGYLQYLPLPGGDAATKKPYRIAIAYLVKLLGGDALKHDFEFLKSVDASEIDIIRHQVDTGLNSPLTSSMGRLFDAVAALTGIRGTIDYDAQAAIELEVAALGHADNAASTGYKYRIIDERGTRIIMPGDILAGIVSDLRLSVPAGTIAAKFHITVAQAISEMCQLISARAGIDTVALSGGVFQNRLLFSIVVPLLESGKFKVLTHKQVPCNDGGISLGQAAIASFC